MKATLAIITLLFTATASAETLQQWTTPDGKTYFGDHPPHGSSIVKTVDKSIGAVETQPINPQERALRAAPQTIWRTGVACQELALTGVKEERFDGVNRRIVRGTVTHDGSHVVKDVKVCGGGACEILRGGRRMAKGESEPFYLDMQTGDPVSLRIECSVREPAA
jgi:hypothetical protein